MTAMLSARRGTTPRASGSKNNYDSYLEIILCKVKLHDIRTVRALLLLLGCLLFAWMVTMATTPAPTTTSLLSVTVTNTPTNTNSHNNHERGGSSSNNRGNTNTNNAVGGIMEASKETKQKMKMTKLKPQKVLAEETKEEEEAQRVLVNENVAQDAQQDTSDHNPDDEDKPSKKQKNNNKRNQSGNQAKKKLTTAPTAAPSTSPTASPTASPTKSPKKDNQKMMMNSKKGLPFPTKSVVCGGHKAASCKKCPQGNGAAWCNGECTWCHDRNECQPKDAFCPVCQEAETQHNERKCKALPQEQQCSWCPLTTTCLHNESVCPTERVWNPPKPEKWFTPPEPIDYYNQTLSIVLPCGNEIDFFERTIKSVFAATPEPILKDIIIIDDNSKPPLESIYTLNKDNNNPDNWDLSKVVFLRSNVTLGLIDAKHQGALLAKGDIIVFFDCHVKPAIGYWEPFVREIAENPKRVVVPSITHLDVDTWVESKRPKDSLGGNSKCFTTLDSDFRWIANDKPWVPTMSGGLLAIGREWFFQIGGHDQNMKGWGGENIDLSFRIWRCGGEIIAAPQSYVGHMWRTEKPNTRAKYSVPANSVIYNRARAMKAHAPEMFAKKTLTFGHFRQVSANGGRDVNVSSILEPLDKLHCKDFDWYLDFFSYIYKDAGIIPKSVFALTPDNGKTCLMLKFRKNWGPFPSSPHEDELVMGNCSSISGYNATAGTQWWHTSNRKKDGTCCSGMQAWNTGQCMTGKLKTYSCDLMNNRMQAQHSTKKGWVKIGKQCLNAEPLSLTRCEKGIATTTWTKYMPFKPPEFEALGPKLQAKW